MKARDVAFAILLVVAICCAGCDQHDSEIAQAVLFVLGGGVLLFVVATVIAEHFNAGPRR